MLHTEMGIVSHVGLYPQLGLVKIIQLTLPSPMSYAKRCLYSVFSAILSNTYIEEILNTSECSWGYGLATEMGIVSQVISCPQLGLVRVSC